MLKSKGWYELNSTVIFVQDNLFADRAREYLIAEYEHDCLQTE
jgi:hypothetical protein